MNESGFNTAGQPSGGIRVPIGNTTGRYRFYKVRRYGKLHFLKCVAEEYKSDLQSVEALRKEFEIGYTLDHPGIARYLSYENGEVYEEFIDGLTIREMMKRFDVRLLDKDILTMICRELLEVLSYIHKNGVLHLDIKPENVMVSNIGNHIKLIDFGCARSAAFDTTEGGTPAYMAPEQQHCSRTDTSTDLYQVGKLMEELTTKAGCYDNWKEFVERATAPNPSARFHTASEALRNLPIPRKKSSPVSPPQPGFPKELPPKKHTSFWSVVGVMLGLAVICGMIWNPFKKGIDEATPQSQFTDIESSEVPTSPEFEQAKQLIKGLGGVKDEKEGVRLMHVAAEKGDQWAQCYLGLEYRDGAPFIQKDYAKSLMWIKKAAEQGNVIAIEELGYKYYEGLGVKQDYPEAMKWLKLAAEKGKSTAYASIGIMYRDGQGVPVDYAHAEEYFRKGSEAGNGFSTFLLGQLYHLYIKPTDSKKAIEWYTKASDMGAYRAHEVLRDIYTQGDSILGISPDTHLMIKYRNRIDNAKGS